MKKTDKKKLSLRIALFTASTIGLLSFVLYILCYPYQEEYELSEEEVPATVLRSFNKLFPDQKVTEWEYENDFYEAEFFQNNLEIEAYFLINGTWVKTSYEILLEQLPAAAADYLTAQKKCKVKDITMIKTQDNQVSYEAELAKGFLEWECVFDQKGKLISRERRL